MEQSVELIITKSKQLFPKTKYNDGDFAIVSCVISETIKGDPHISNWGNIVITGNMPYMKNNTKYRFIGTEKYDEKRGSFSCEVGYMDEYTNNLTDKDFELYLSDVLTPAQFKKVKKVAGIKVLLDNRDVKALTEIKGIGEGTAIKIIEKYTTNKANASYIARLSAIGVSETMRNKLLDRYKSYGVILSKLTENPYVLAEDIDGIGFSKADELGMKAGMDENDPRRIRALIYHVLNTKSMEGQSYIYLSDVVKEIVDKIYKSKESDLDKALVGGVLSNMLESEVIWASDDRQYIGLYEIYRLEQSLAKEIIRISKQQNKFDYQGWEDEVAEIEKEQGWKYTDEQRNGILTSLKDNFVMVVGKAGSGKTTVTNAMSRILSKKNYTIAQACLSGKASLRMQEVTGRDASTIHRLLEFNPQGGFVRNKDYPINADIIIIDEVSMVDTRLMLSLLKAVKDTTKVIFLGDPAQLPSIGLGNIMTDLLNHKGIVSVVELTQIHRQAQKSAIITQSIAMRENKMIVPYNFQGTITLGELQDLTLDIDENKESLPYKVLEYFKEGYNNLKNIMDICIVCPTRLRGKLSCFNMNTLVKSWYNPLSNECREGVDYIITKVSTNYHYVISLGDKVLVTKNNYHAEVWDESKGEFVEGAVFNGNLGVVTEIGVGYIEINIDPIGRVRFKENKYNTLELGYAVTCHKCLTEDTYILTDSGIKQLKDIDNSSGFLGEFPLDNIKVFNGKDFEKPSVFINAGERDVVKLTTKRGYEIEGTLDHKLNVLDKNGFIIQKEIKDIEHGDNLILIRNSNVFGNNIKFPDKCYDTSHLNVRSIEYKYPNTLDEGMSELIGMIVADGTVSTKRVKFSKKHKDVSLRFRELLMKYFGYNVVPKLRSSGDYMCEVSSTYIANFFMNIDGVQPHNKKVPSIILSSNKKNQCAFLRGLFEDGTVNLKKDTFDHIELTMGSNSFEFIKQVQHLLLNIGVVSTYRKIIQKNNLEKYALYIYKDYANIFLDEIGFISEFKKSRLELCKNNKKRNASRYVTPYIQNIMKSICIELDVKVFPKASLRSLIFTSNEKANTSGVTKEMLQLFLGMFKDIPTGEIADLDYLRFINEKCYVDKVAFKSNSRKNTYCISMPETNQFVQNGFYGSNCQGSQFKNTIVAMDMSGYSLLSSEWGYTAITRAMDEAVVVSEPNALHRCCTNNLNSLKFTFLGMILYKLKCEGEF